MSGKILTIAVPCFNSQGHIRRCIDSLLVGGEELEILIVNDGSTDNTGKIADEYSSLHPGIVKSIHQENGGHGTAVNTGLLNASGIYFKVVDSDDMIDAHAYLEILRTLNTLREKDQVDLLISNFIYDKAGKKHKSVMRFRRILPDNRVFGWEDVGHFRNGQYILMHSMIYRTAFLRQCGLKLPKHTFYIDNLYAYLPIPFVKTMYYLDVDFYRYYIGREGQSVHESTMIKNIDQQLLVNHIMIDSANFEPADSVRMRNYMLHYLGIITTVSSVMLLLSGTEESLLKKKELWEYIYKQKPEVYNHLRYSTFGFLVNLPGKIGRKITIFLYRMSQKTVGFNF